MESTTLINNLVALGVPGVVLGVFYLLLNRFGFKFREISSNWAAVIAILFLTIVGLITFYGLQQWSPRSGSSDSRNQPEENQKEKFYIISWSVFTVDKAKEKVKLAKSLGYKDAYYLLKDGSDAIAIVIKDNVEKEHIRFAIDAAKKSGLPRDTYHWPMNYVQKSSNK